ncbi:MULTISPECIES: DsbC family protein [Asticcacaulis]|uniref:DsbC family protein n=1 Tax=Asticcacaulis TaxID=76890 RepID=UPI001AE496A0|nr:MULTISPECIES: DsbC family protein [Asticcacaulis]MBP2159063.1 thiol:disulfide interchange protein DsbC [Asticcacaulis solisilvae]MDR6800108.1 thiol:disulfide interchange protein DsbC [Asticcacaulis sp. BE141]
MTDIIGRFRAAVGPRSGAIIFAVSALALSGAVISGATLAASSTKDLQSDLQTQFPKTRITRIDCKTAVSGLCEVTAGRNLFYASRDGRYVVVGSLLDLEKKVDLTDERLRQLAAVEGATGNLADARVASATSTEIHKINVDLPMANAIVHHPGAPLKVKVFSDFSCGYCRAFFSQLAADQGIEITEYPIAVLGEESRRKAIQVLCAKDRRAASEAAYAGRAFALTAKCNGAEEAVDQNTAFARAHGVQGTPTIVRADGGVNPGFLDPTALKAFAESKS